MIKRYKGQVQVVTLEIYEAEVEGEDLTVDQANIKLHEIVNEYTDEPKEREVTGKTVIHTELIEERNEPTGNPRPTTRISL